MIAIDTMVIFLSASIALSLSPGPDNFWRYSIVCGIFRRVAKKLR